MRKTIYTPIQQLGDIWLKRDDLYMVAGANGAKSRQAFIMVKEAIKKGYKEVTTAGSRFSPQINIIARISEYFGLKFTAHTPTGKLSDVILDAKERGANIIQHKYGYNSVIIKRAKDYAEKTGAFYIPFWMMSREGTQSTSNQVKNIPKGVKRIVIIGGSGVNLAGLLLGLKRENIYLPVLAVQVGANFEKTLDNFAPENWRDIVTIVKSKYAYHDKVKSSIGGVELDEIYEAKAVEYLQAGDLFWIIGIRATQVKGLRKFNYENKPK